MGCHHSGSSVCIENAVFCAKKYKKQEILAFYKSLFSLKWENNKISTKNVGFRSFLY